MLVFKGEYGSCGKNWLHSDLKPFHSMIVVEI